jgi:hypothetical protein
VRNGTRSAITGRSPDSSAYGRQNQWLFHIRLWGFKLYRITGLKVQIYGWPLLKRGALGGLVLAVVADFQIFDTDGGATRVVTNTVECVVNMIASTLRMSRSSPARGSACTRCGRSARPPNRAVECVLPGRIDETGSASCGSSQRRSVTCR